MRVNSLLAAALAWLISLGPAVAQSSPDPADLVRAFSGSFIQIEQAVAALAATGDPRVEPLLESLQAGALYVRKADKSVVAAREQGDGFALFDPLTGAALGEADRFALDKVKMNNRLRLAVAGAIGALKLANPDPAARSAAAEAVFRSRDAEALPLLDAAIAKESDRKVKIAMERARAAILITDASADAAKRVAAAQLLGSLTDRDALPLLGQAANDANPAVAAAAQAGTKSIQSALVFWDAIQNIYYGVSLGSVLLLAAIGLAVTFGVMGVINMAHGEMVMIGAYAAFLTQQGLRLYVPGLADWSVLISLPVSFAVAFLIGVAIERTVIRFLYGRPLETLLATFGVSLVLQQAVRSLFGPTNREVSAPSWMSGATDLGGLLLTYNRLWIIAFALIAFTGLIALIRFSRFGLFVRAVVQNRAMAGSMGVNTNRIDAVTFGLGSGIAGIAGVALSQIDNVSPNLGQSYIIDSFMVVVFGGVGNLWGTLVGALTLGVANKLLEPYAGAVLGKILLLVFIILFIQKRPRGLFALKGRAVEQ